MSPDHVSQLDMIKALRELGATHVKVGDVECRFDLVLAPLKAVSDDAVMRETAETMLERKIRDLERNLGISLT